MSTHQKNNNEEEVDLGSLFVIIGRGFSNFFHFIGSIFKAFFHFIITLLLFLKQHLLKIVIASIVGGILGTFLDYKKEKTYGSELLLQPNFESTRQLYNNVNFYNDLVKQKDTSSIEKVFKLTKEKAASLKKFKIEPVRLENDIISGYDDLILAVDTLAIKSYTYYKFKQSFTDFDYKIHKITVISQNNDVFKELENSIIFSVTNNKYFERVKMLTNENLNRTDSLLRRNLGQADSLFKVYMQVLLAEATKVSSGTSIDLGGEKGRTKELDLFETNKKINAELKDVVSDKSREYEVINIISSFQPVGSEIKGVTENYGFLLALFSAGLVILVLLLVQLNEYLNNYKK
jgi:hypothetical protein